MDRTIVNHSSFHPEFVIDKTLAEVGASKFGNCAACHGGGAVSAGMAPDLRASAIPFDKAEFASVVRDGTRVGMGMPAFPDISDEQLDGLRTYIRMVARKSLEEAQPLGKAEQTSGH